MLTVFMGSMMAFQEKNLKKRLAYSSISQISYIMIGLSCLNGEGMRGGFVQLLSHAAAKGCLFMCAGAFIHQLGLRNVADLKGIGKRMPVTLSCFTAAALSLVGIPPMGGFTAKWMIAAGAIGNKGIVLTILPPVILLISAILTAGYLLPVTVDGFFPEKAGDEDLKDETLQTGRAKKREQSEKQGRQPVRAQDQPQILPGAGAEPPLTMLIPMIGLCIVALAAGIFGASMVSFVPLP